jgi:hypothetical protein
MKEAAAMLRRALKRFGLVYLICGLLTGIYGDVQEIRFMRNEGAMQTQIISMAIGGLIGSLVIWPAFVAFQVALHFGVIPRSAEIGAGKKPIRTPSDSN